MLGADAMLASCVRLNEKPSARSELAESSWNPRSKEYLAAGQTDLMLATPLSMALRDKVDV